MDVTSEYPVKVGTTTVHVDHALLDESPAVFVESKASQQKLNDDFATQLMSYMRSAEVEWGLLTNGEKFQIMRFEPSLNSQENHLLAEVSLTDFDSSWEVMRILSKGAITSGESSELADQFDERKQGIKSLQENKLTIVDEITDVLVNYSNDSFYGEIKSEVDNHVDDLINELKLEPSDDVLPKTPTELLDTVGTVLPGRTDEVRHSRADVVLSVYEFLQDQKVVNRDGIESHLINRCSTRFTQEDDEFERHWVNYIRDALAELPRIEQPARGAAQFWRYVTPELDQQIKVDSIDEWILDLKEVPSGSRESIDRQQAMIQQAYDYIKQNKEASQDEFERALPPYTAHYQDFSGFWIYCLRKALAEAKDITKPTAGHQSWYYTGDSDEQLPPELELSIDEWLFEQDIPGNDFVLRERQLLVQFAYNHLQKIEEAKRGDFEYYFKETVPEHTGYYNTFNGFWSYVLKETLKSAPNVRTSQSSKGSPTVYYYKDDRASS